MNVEAFRQQDGMLIMILTKGEYVVDDKPVIVREPGEHVVIEEASVLNGVFLVENVHVRTEYRQCNSDVVLTQEEYSRKEAELTIPLSASFRQQYPESELVRMAIELEVLRHVWNRVPVTQRELRPVIIDIKGEYIPEHKYIKALRKVGGDYTTSLCTYSPSKHAADVTVETLKALGYRALLSSPPTFGSPADRNNTFYIKGGVLEYSKIYTPTSDSFITIVISGLKQFEKSSTKQGTYAEMLKLYERNNIEITSALKAYFTRHNPITDVGVTTIGEVLAKLRTAEQRLAEVESMKRTQDEYRSARKAVQEAVTLLTSSLNQISVS